MAKVTSQAEPAQKTTRAIRPDKEKYLRSYGYYLPAHGEPADEAVLFSTNLDPEKLDTQKFQRLLAEEAALIYFSVGGDADDWPVTIGLTDDHRKQIGLFQVGMDMLAKDSGE